MTRPRTKPQGGKKSKRHADPHAADTPEQPGAERDATAESSDRSYADVSPHSQYPQQGPHEYPPYSSFRAFTTDTTEDPTAASVHMDTDAATTAASMAARYRQSRPTPLQTTAVSSASCRAVPSPTSCVSYTTTNTKRTSTQHTAQTQRAPSSGGAVQRGPLSGLSDALGASLSQLSPIMASSSSLPSASSGSFFPPARGGAGGYGSFTSVPGTPFTPASPAAAGGNAARARGSVVTSRAVPRSRGTSNAYTSALPTPSSTMLSTAASRTMNDGFVREEGELEFHEDLAASLPSTALAAPSFVASTLTSPMYARPRGSVRASTAVYGPSAGVSLQFAQFVDLTTREETMEAFGLAQRLRVDIAGGEEPAATTADIAAVGDNVHHTSQAAATAFMDRPGVSVVGDCAPVYAPSASILAAAATVTPSAGGGSTSFAVPAPHSHAQAALSRATATMAEAPKRMETTCEASAWPSADATAAFLDNATPSRPTTSTDDTGGTEDPSPRPHLPPVRSSGPNSAVRGVATAEAAPQTSTTPASRPRAYSSTTTAYMTEAGEPADAAQVSPFDKTFIRQSQSHQSHHTALFTEEVATPLPTAQSGARPFHSSSNLSPYSAPWTPASAAADTTPAVSSTPPAQPHQVPSTASKDTRKAPSSAAPTTAPRCAKTLDATASMDSECDNHMDELGGLTLSQRRSAKKSQKKASQKSSTDRRDGTHEQAHSPGEAAEQETFTWKAGSASLGTALQQALDEALEDEVHVVMPTRLTTAEKEAALARDGAQLQQLKLGGAFHGAPLQQQQEPHNGSTHVRAAVTDSAVLLAQPKRGAEVGRQADGRAARDHPMAYTVTVEGHRSITTEVLSTAPVETGSYVLFEADRGRDIGRVLACRSVPEMNETNDANGSAGRRVSSYSKRQMPPHVLRLATASEVHTWLNDQVTDARAALKSCREAVKAAHLQLNVVDAVYQFSKNKLTFFYDSDERVDFRHLLQTLFSQFQCRIWMQKIPTATSATPLTGA